MNHKITLALVVFSLAVVTVGVIAMSASKKPKADNSEEKKK
jgi:hypothetical protein|tara:strand:+ start:1815 stop:1937 length:123 start_codon:yes stop_codon:yes gene_type:complete